MLGSDESIKMGISYVKVLGTILRNLYGTKIGLYVGTYMGSLNGSLDGYNVEKLEGLLIEEPLVYTSVKVIGYDKGIKLGSTDGRVFGTILGDLA